MNAPFHFLFKCWPSAAIIAYVLLGLPVGAHAGIITYSVNLTGPNESPTNNSLGVGSGQVVVDTTAHTMLVDFSFSGLQGNTTAAHIHAPTVDPFLLTAGVATTTPTFSGFPLGVTSGSYTNTLDLTQASSYNPTYVTANGGTPASAETALLAAIGSGRAYLNVHTSAFPGGEIRSFLVVSAVPEPSSIFLSGLVAIGLVSYFRRKRNAAQA